MTSRFTQIFLSKTSLDKLCENTAFQLPALSRMRTESAIISLYVKIWVSENPYSRVFHTMHITNNNINPYLPHFLP